LLTSDWLRGYIGDRC